MGFMRELTVCVSNIIIINLKNRYNKDKNQK